MPTLEALPDLNPLDRRHVCQRCGELWVYRETEVHWGLVVRVYCPNNHGDSVYLPDLPDRILTTV